MNVLGIVGRARTADKAHVLVREVLAAAASSPPA